MAQGQSKRTADEVRVESRRSKVAEKMLRGYVSQAEMAKEFGVSRACIAKDQAKIRKQWANSTVRNFDEAQASELLKLDKLEAEYWAAWDKSKEPHVTHKTRPGRRRKGEEGDPTPETEETVEYTAGHPRFLDGVLECVRSRCKLLGLDEADMIERARQRAAQQAQVNVQINVASLTVVDALAMAERGEAIPQEVLLKMAPADLVQVHRKMIEGG